MTKETDKQQEQQQQQPEDFLASLPKDKIPSLFTADQILEFRRQKYAENKGRCPITGLAVPFNETVVDHDHRSQHCRDALHRQSNSFEGLVWNAFRRCIEWQDKSLSFPQVLRNLANYIEKDYSSNPYHPGWIKRCDADFTALNSFRQKLVLDWLGIPRPPVSSRAERIRLLRKFLLTKKHGYETIKYVIDCAKLEHEGKEIAE